jgi:MOSC domain-containing protein YiiM
MKLISVNTGREQTIQYARKSGTTGIFKQPAGSPVMVNPLGLEGDAVIDVENHGGLDQAVYVYGWPDYAWWSAELGTEILPGTFGDNLTIDGLESARTSIGDVLRVGAVVLQVTSPRIPCSTLGARMGDNGFVKRFRYAERPGVYCRVLQPGPVQSGDPVTWEPYSGPTVTTLEMFRNFYKPSDDAATYRRYLEAPIAIRARVEMEEKLRKLTQV